MKNLSLIIYLSIITISRFSKLIFSINNHSEIKIIIDADNSKGKELV